MRDQTTITEEEEVEVIVAEEEVAAHLVAVTEIEMNKIFPNISSITLR